jgi:hypothetical protein
MKLLWIFGHIFGEGYVSLHASVHFPVVGYREVCDQGKRPQCTLFSPFFNRDLMEILMGTLMGFNNGDLSWWFGTYELYVSMYWEWNVIIPTDELIFFRGVGSTTNQGMILWDLVNPKNTSPILVDSILFNGHSRHTKDGDDPQ